MISCVNTIYVVLNVIKDSRKKIQDFSDFILKS